MLNTAFYSSDRKRTAATVLVAFLLSVVLGTSVQADDKKAADALVGQLEKSHSLSASFAQQSIGSDGRTKNESGVVQIKRPDHLRWLTETPFQQEIVASKGKVWVIEPDLEQIIIHKQESRLASTPAQLLTRDPKETIKRFAVSLYQRGNASTFTLIPRQESDLFEKLDIGFTGNTLAFMELKDSLGGKTRIRFSDVKMNEAISDKVFEVVIPKHFEVIDETRASTSGK